MFVAPPSKLRERHRKIAFRFSIHWWLRRLQILQYPICLIYKILRISGRRLSKLITMLLNAIATSPKVFRWQGCLMHIIYSYFSNR